MNKLRHVVSSTVMLGKYKVGKGEKSSQDFKTRKNMKCKKDYFGQIYYGKEGRKSRKAEWCVTW